MVDPGVITALIVNIIICFGLPLGCILQTPYCFFQHYRWVQMVCWDVPAKRCPGKSVEGLKHLFYPPFAPPGKIQPGLSPLSFADVSFLLPQEALMIQAPFVLGVPGARDVYRFVPQ